MKLSPLAKTWLGAGWLLLPVLLIKLFALSSVVVEAWYSTGLYQFIAAFLRAIFGWIPFSMGDVLYAFIFIALITWLIKAVKAVIKRKVTWLNFLQRSGKLVKNILWIYIVFNVLWGLNYDRAGIAYQLQLQPASYTTGQLKTLTDSLIQKVNRSRRLLKDTVITYDANKVVFTKATEAYKNVAAEYTFLKYRNKSVKASLYGRLGNYLGFLGYYNPFTGEAQVNVAVPGFLIPYVTCHEMAHQLGYATEDEANFAGYLAAKSSGETLFQYSVYFDLFSYANRELFVRDSAAARYNYRQLDTLVKIDFRTYRNYVLAHKNPLEPIISLFYGQYLKANNQPKGLDTYSDVVAWLIAYQKKYKFI